MPAATLLPCPGSPVGDRYPDAVPVNEPRAEPLQSGHTPKGRASVRWQHLVDGLAGADVTGDPSVEVTDLTHDSRRATPGACFACIPGALADGHAFAAEAVAAGAVALLTERPLGIAAARGIAPGVGPLVAPLVAEACVPSVRAALGKPMADGA